MKYIKNLIQGDCTEEIIKIESNSINCILTDPPYLYLKKQKLEREFDEVLFFTQCKRVLKDDGFIVLFGRGPSFYRWNAILTELGFVFKEEIIWDKGYTSSSVLPLSRVHETISIWSKSTGKIKKVRVPYVESRAEDIASIARDIKRIKAALNNTKEFDALLKYIENRIITNYKDKTKSKFGATVSDYTNGFVSVSNCASIIEGIIEKSIIKVQYSRYNNIVPTQKPVSLLKRLLALTTDKGDIVADFFGGSFSTAVACLDLGLYCIICEIEEEFYTKGKKRILEYYAKLQENIAFDL